MADPARRGKSDPQTVAELTREVEALRLQLDRTQRLAAVGTMAAMVAHEFNNILVPLHNYAQLAREGDEAMRDKAVHHASEGSARAAAVCRALLDLAAQKDREPPRRVAVAQLVAEILTAMAREPAKDGIRLIQRIRPDLTVVTQPLELKQVLLNLLLNARAAALERGRGRSIAISALRRDGEVLIRVADTGIGIPPENLRRIFEPFFSTRPDGGTGLGLAVSRRLVETLDGRLTVRSQRGKGSCFTIALPAEATPPKAANPSGKIEVEA